MKGRYVVIKKLISAVAAAAIAITAFAGLASAEKTYDLSLGSGVSYTDGVDTYGSQYFTVWCKDLAGGYLMAETVTIKVVSGQIGEDTANYEWDVVGGLSTQRGMYTPGRAKTYFQGTAYTKNVWTDDAGVQWIAVSWAGTAPAMTDDGMLFEFYVTPKTSEDIELEIVGLNTVTSSNSSGGDKSEAVFAPEVAPQYVLAAGTSTITEKSSATPTPVVTEAPTATPTVEPTPEVTPEPTATPEPTEGKGVEKFSATDAAAWAWETAAVAGSKVKVTVTDGTTEGAKTFDLNAAVEGSVKVGVIVQYNPTAFPNFAIVDVEIQ